jgi:hypothetical protein
MKKSLLIKGDIHQQLKEYCEERGLKMKFVIETLIIKYIKDGNEKMPRM